MTMTKEGVLVRREVHPVSPEFAADRLEPDTEACDPGDGGPGVGVGWEHVHQGVGHPNQPAQDVTEDVFIGESLCFGVNLHDYCSGNCADKEDNQDDSNHHCNFPFLSLSHPLPSSHHFL